MSVQVACRDSVLGTHRHLTAVRQLAELQRECLVAYDRLIRCCEEIGLDHESLVALHQGRAELALRPQNALVDVEELTSATSYAGPLRIAVDATEAGV
jgi:hypothetical protein